MTINDVNCLACPSSQFELPQIRKSRFIAICHSRHVVLRPIFPEHLNAVINKANINDVRFEPVDNCPHLEELRKQGIIPWASYTIDFLNK
jgi:hypothetical protein